MDDAAITLEAATERDRTLLDNLLQLYIHDLSAIFDIEAGADGRFSYDKLPLYWSEPRRFPFLIRRSGRTIGFVLATRGSPASDDPDVLDVAEFFILRRERRGGSGRSAAFLLWQRLPGAWTVRVSIGNRRGTAFWSKVTAEYAGDVVQRWEIPGEPHPWQVFSFATASVTS